MNESTKPEGMSEKVRVPRQHLQDALNYINHCGANATMRGQPHPQQWIVDNLTAALAAAPGQEGERMSKEERAEIRASFVGWLCGAQPHPDTGIWFERPADAKGAFWWRSVLQDEIMLCKQKPRSPLSRKKREART